jgi:hypothetical protein
MKPIYLKGITIVCCVLITQITSTFGQYKSIFGKSTTEWNVIFGGGPESYISSKMFVNGDTIINNHTYQRIMTYLMGSEKEKFLREDTALGKVWHLNQSLSREILIMNLSLNKSDSFRVFYDFYTDSIDLIVDTVFVNNGIKYVQFGILITIGKGFELFKFIEGTGTNAGLFYYFIMDDYLLCHWKDGEKVFGNTLFLDTCEVDIIGKLESLIEKEVLIYPVPAKDHLHIQYKNPCKEIVDLKIYNSKGQLTHDISTTNSEIEIYFTALTTEINFYTLYINKTWAKSDKFLKL